MKMKAGAVRGCKALCLLVFGEPKPKCTTKQSEEMFRHEEKFWTETNEDPVADLLEYFSWSQANLATENKSVEPDEKKSLLIYSRALARHARELRRELLDAWKPVHLTATSVGVKRPEVFVSPED